MYDYAFPDQALFKIKFTSIYEDYWEIIETSYFISLLPTEFFLKRLADTLTTVLHGIDEL